MVDSPRFMDCHRGAAFFLVGGNFRVTFCFHPLGAGKVQHGFGHLVFVLYDHVGGLSIVV